MSASLAIFLAAQIVVPLGKPPPRIDPPKAPIERAGPAWFRSCGDSTDWDKPAPPVRIHANTYLVGTCGLSSILITGNQGHILIDGGSEQAADLIAANIRQLGFKLTDVRYLLHSHEHLDHVGGLARLQQLTGATVVSSEPARAVLASGVVSADDPQVGMSKPFPDVTVGRTIADGQALPLGNLYLTAHTTPGHTPGALTWSWESCDGAVCRSMVYADSLSPVSSDTYRFSDHPAYVAAYRASLAKVAAMRCEILLTPHPAASATKERMVGLQPLFDPTGCKAYAGRLTEALNQRLAKEAATR